MVYYLNVQYISRTRFMYHRSPTATFGFKMGSWRNLVNNYAGVMYHGTIEKRLNVTVSDI